MSEPDTTSDDRALRRLSAVYAFAADRRDGQMYAGVFQPDGCLRVHRPADSEAPISEIRGHEELTKLPGMLTKSYERTFHFVGQSLYEILDREASGVVYCQAYHLVAGRHGGVSYLMHIRYEDRYLCTDLRHWRIASRDVWIEWTETCAVNPMGT